MWIVNPSFSVDSFIDSCWVRITHIVCCLFLYLCHKMYYMYLLFVSLEFLRKNVFSTRINNNNMKKRKKFIVEGDKGASKVLSRYLVCICIRNVSYVTCEGSPIVLPAWRRSLVFVISVHYYHWRTKYKNVTKMMIKKTDACKIFLCQLLVFGLRNISSLLQSEELGKSVGISFFVVSIPYKCYLSLYCINWRKF